LPIVGSRSDYKIQLGLSMVLLSLCHNIPGVHSTSIAKLDSLLQVDDNISISEYPLSAAYCLARITTAFEQKWKIV
jgi:hypothetical protein